MTNKLRCPSCGCYININVRCFTCSNCNFRTCNTEELLSEDEYEMQRETELVMDDVGINCNTKEKDNGFSKS